ncbi:O-antigen ligase family protein [Pseudomonas sp. Z3-8]|uniref:O-antigen ligase family protein n=1 Tax=unclassified Pseudomonas TaxID=196821 RepID=UPI003DA97CB7
MTRSVFTRYTVLVLMIGFTVHLTGLLFITDGSTYTTISNLSLFLPALLLCIVDARLRQSLVQKCYWPVLLMLAFSLLIALLNSGSTTSAFSQFKTVLYVTLYLGTVHILAREGLLEKSLTFAFAVAGLFAIAGLLIHFVQQDQNIFFMGGRLFNLGYGDYANFKNPIIAALYYGFFGIYGFHLLLTKPCGPWLRVFYMACVAGLSLYLFCTLSRAVWLGYGLAVCTSIVLHHTPRTRKWLYLTGALFLVAIAWLWPVIIDQQSRGFSLRDLIWAGWLSRIQEFWLFGAGAGSNFDICILEAQCFNQVHNLFLQFFYEFGVIGATLLLLAVTHVFRYSIDRKTWSHPLGSVGLPLLIFGLVTAMFDYHTVFNRPGVYWIVFWLPVGIILSQRFLPGPAPCKEAVDAH